MIKSREYFKKIYFIQNIDKLAKKELDKLLLCDSLNWDFYFCKITKADKHYKDFETLNNAELVEFEKEDEAIKFWNETDDTKRLSYSTEHDFPCVLKYV